ncbi:MAG TPA: hypothetical protein VF746_18680 [Longimicrobium sp.]|jgi:hypothetical protein
MEPLKPETKARILEESLQAAPEDIEEYERLLSERFTVDPDLPASPEAAHAVDERESRLQELARKLFPHGHAAPDAAHSR